MRRPRECASRLDTGGPPRPSHPTDESRPAAAAEAYFSWPARQVPIRCQPGGQLAVLLVRSRNFSDSFVFPGGGIEPGETEAQVRVSLLALPFPLSAPTHLSFAPPHPPISTTVAPPAHRPPTLFLTPPPSCTLSALPHRPPELFPTLPPARSPALNAQSRVYARRGGPTLSPPPQPRVLLPSANPLLLLKSSPNPSSLLSARRWKRLVLWGTLSPHPHTPSPPPFHPTHTPLPPP